MSLFCIVFYLLNVNHYYYNKRTSDIFSSPKTLEETNNDVTSRKKKYFIPRNRNKRNKIKRKNENFSIKFFFWEHLK